VPGQIFYIFKKFIKTDTLLVLLDDPVPFSEDRFGGSWNSKPDGVRSANRIWGGPTDRSVNLGFRVARTLP